MYRIPRVLRRRLIVSMVARVCSVRSSVYQSRQIKRSTLRSSFTVGSSRRYATIEIRSSFSAVLSGLIVHFIVGCSSGGSDPAGLSRWAILCQAAAWRALVRFFGVVMVCVLVDLLSFSTVQYKFPRRILREIPKPQAGNDQFRNGLARYADSVVEVSVSDEGSIQLVRGGENSQSWAL